MKHVNMLLKRFMKSRELALMVGIQFLCAAKDMGGIFALAYATDEILNRGHIIQAFMIISVIMLIGVLLTVVDNYYKESLLVKIRKGMLSAYEEKLRTIRLDQMEALDTNQLLNEYSGDLARICYWFQWRLPKVIQLVIYLAIAFAYSVSCSAVLTLTVMPAVVIMVPFLMKIVGKLGMIAQEERKTSDSIMKKISEIFFGTEMIKSFGIEEIIEEKVNQQLQEKQRLDYRSAVYKAFSKALSFIISYLPGILAGLAGAWFLMKGEITVGFLVAFIQMVMGRVSFSFPELSEYVAATHEMDVYAERVLNFLARPDEVSSGTFGSSAMVRPVVSFEHVGFAYPGRTPILVDLSFSVNQGEKVSLVGQSGCGKSTILKLIMGYYNDLYTGSIKIKGVELRDWNPKALQMVLAPIFQDNILFSGTVKDNLAMVDRFGKMEEICNEFDFSEEFLNKEVGEKGIKVSGGQRQQIALVRGQLKQAEIYLLDEPLANVDKTTESRILAQMRKAMKGRTVLLVEHCLEAVIDSDKICYIEDGTVAEEGMHDELMKKEGRYASLFTQRA